MVIVCSGFVFHTGTGWSVGGGVGMLLGFLSQRSALAEGCGHYLFWIRISHGRLRKSISFDTDDLDPDECHEVVWRMIRSLSRRGCR